MTLSRCLGELARPGSSSWQVGKRPGRRGPGADSESLAHENDESEARGIASSAAFTSCSQSVTVPASVSAANAGPGSLPGSESRTRTAHRPGLMAHSPTVLSSFAGVRTQVLPVKVTA